MNYLNDIFSNFQNIWSLSVLKKMSFNSTIAMASCSDDKSQLTGDTFTLEDKKADQSEHHHNSAKILNENIPDLTDNSEEDNLNKGMIGDSITKLKENTNSTDIIEQIDINNDDKMQLQSFDNGCNEFNNFATNNKFLNKNEEMEQIDFNDIDNDSYIDLDEFDKLVNYNSNTDEVAYTINMVLDEIIKTIDIKHKKQDEASDNDLNTANYSAKNATIISNDDTLAVIKDLTDDNNMQLNKTYLYKNGIKESDVIVGNINLCDNSEITNNKENCTENTMNALTYQTEYTRPNNNAEFTDISKFDPNLCYEDLLQDIVLDVETFSVTGTENYENTTNRNSMIESPSKVTAVEMTDMREIKTRALPGENMDCDKSSKTAPDDNSESLLQRKVDEETLNNNNIDDLLSDNLESNFDLFTIVISSDEESDKNTLHNFSKNSKKPKETRITDISPNRKKFIPNVIDKHSSTITNREYNFKSTTENNSKFTATYNKDSLRHIRRNFSNTNYSKTKANETARLRQYRFQAKRNILAVKDLVDYNLNILNSSNKSIQTVNNTANINSHVKPKQIENVKYICETNNIKNLTKVSLNNVESFSTKAVITANNSLYKNESRDDISSKSFNNMTANKTETKTPNNMINPVDSNKLESNNQTSLYDSNIISTQENINKLNIVTPKQNQYSKSIKDNAIAEHDLKFDKKYHNIKNTDIVQNNLYTAASTSHPVISTMNTISSGQNVSKMCIKSSKTLEGQRDIKNVSNDTDSDYNSSDFEFISENEAKTDLLLDKTIDTSQYDISNNWNWNAYVYRLQAGNKYPGPTNYQKRHEVPRGEAYLRLFRESEYHPVLSNIHMMENKSIRPSQSNDQYRGMGFDMRLTRREDFDNGHEGNAKATMKKIYSMYPADNKRRL